MDATFTWKNAERFVLFAAGAVLWAVLYFAVGRWNVGRNASVIVWDPVWHFPKISAFVIPYLSAYAMPFMVLAVVRDRRTFRRFSLIAAATIAVSSIFFIAWPLTILRYQTGTSLFDRMLAWLYLIDKPTNLFPSLHVSTAFLFAKAVAYARPKWNPWMVGWATLVAASTLFIRQHYLVDVIAGIITAYAGWWMFLRWQRR